MGLSHLKRRSASGVCSCGSQAKISADAGIHALSWAERGEAVCVRKGGARRRHEWGEVVGADTYAPADTFTADTQAFRLSRQTRGLARQGLGPAGSCCVADRAAEEASRDSAQKLGETSAARAARREDKAATLECSQCDEGRSQDPRTVEGGARHAHEPDCASDELRINDRGRPLKRPPEALVRAKRGRTHRARFRPRAPSTPVHRLTRFLSATGSRPGPIVARGAASTIRAPSSARRRALTSDFILPMFKSQARPRAWPGGGKSEPSVQGGHQEFVLGDVTRLRHHGALSISANSCRSASCFMP